MDIYDRLGKVGSVGGIIGTSVSATFLFLVACINSYFLVGAVRARKRAKARKAAGLPPEEMDITSMQGGGCMVRLIGPILRAVDRPWKLYPVGVLFGEYCTLVAMVSKKSWRRGGKDFVGGLVGDLEVRDGWPNHRG